MKRIIFTLFTVGIVLLLFPRCAKVVSPTGGPKDTIQPVLVNSTPKANATGWRGQKIVLEFDEFIQLKEVQQKLLISPPLKTKPIPNQKGKRVEFLLTDTLKANTTYTFYFSDAIRDNNEGNPINNFIFSFSTGDVLDTLSLSGRVTNSFTNEPVENALVMLYDSPSDTLPYITLPNHIAKTDKEGKFTLVNLKPVDYKIVVITDSNGNYLYNQGAEDIGYSSTLVTKDLLTGKGTEKKNVNLRMFREQPPHQVLTGYDRPERYLLTLNFSRKPLGKYQLNLTGFPNLKDWFVAEPNFNGDSLKLWITNPEVANRDTLMAVLQYLKTDSLYRLKPQTDSLRFLFLKEETRSKSGRGRKTDQVESPKKGFAITSLQGADRSVIPGQPVLLSLPMPAMRFEKSKIEIYNATDSIAVENFSVDRDTLNPRLYSLKCDWKSLTDYKIQVNPGAFTDYTLITNDTLKFSLTGADPEKFGTLKVQFSEVANSVIVELTTEKGATVYSQVVKGNSAAVFEFVTPGKYKLRFIEDSNNNGRWDTGSYMRKIQPERVFYFTDDKTKGVISIRANWDTEMQYTIPK